MIGAERELYDQRATQPGGWLGWRPFEVARKVDESEEISSFYLVPTDGKDLPPFEPGQFVSVKRFVGELGLDQRRHARRGPRDRQAGFGKSVCPGAGRTDSARDAAAAADGPDSTGPDATDPNLVASYLDNELDQDLVPEYEKLCLTSDVHMAEVASVHQILSLIGQKAKVPDEAKNRMYHLVRGRETIAKRARPSHAAAAADPEPIGPWVTPPPPSRPWYERYGPAVAALSLLVLLCWSAWMSLQPAQPPGTELAGPVSPNAGKPRKPALPPSTSRIRPQPKPRSRRRSPSGAEDPAALAEGRGGVREGRDRRAGQGRGPRPDLPPGVIGMTEKPDGVLLRYNTEQPGVGAARRPDRR